MILKCIDSIHSFFIKATESAICLPLLYTVSCKNTFYKYIFRWPLSTYLLWLMVFGNIPSGIQHYRLNTYILANNAQDYTLCWFEFKWDTNRIKKYFLSMPRFEPWSLRFAVFNKAQSINFKNLFSVISQNLVFNSRYYITRPDKHSVKEFISDNLSQGPQNEESTNTNDYLFCQFLTAYGIP
jgi:hypothetical protein